MWARLGCAGLILSLGPYLIWRGEALESISLPYLWLRNIPGFAIFKSVFRFIGIAQLSFAMVAAFAVGSIRELPALRRLGERTLTGIQIAILLLVMCEFVTAKPVAEALTHSAVAYERAYERAHERSTDDRVYSVLTYPLTAPIIGSQIQMWEQVLHEGRLLHGFIARRQKNLEGWARPYHHSNDAPRAQLAYLNRLIANPRYRIEYLVFIPARRGPMAETHQFLLHELEQRYPLVSVEEARWSPILGASDKRWVFRTGGAGEALGADVDEP